MVATGWPISIMENQFYFDLERLYRLMLDVLRKRKRSWIIIFLLGPIIVVFIAFYGGNKFRGSGCARYCAGQWRSHYATRICHALPESVGAVP